MERVQARGGRLIVTVFDSLGNNPGYTAMAEALEEVAG